jgi:hypothetical protein
VGKIERPEQLFTEIPSVSKNDAECPAGLPVSFHEKSKAILAPPGPASVADTVGAHDGNTTPDTVIANVVTTTCLIIFNFVFILYLY